MNWLVIGALLIGTLGGGAGVAYAADGSAPGSPLYGLDRMMENVRYATAFSAESRVEVALAHANERVAEARQLAATGGQESDVQTAVDGYGMSVSRAAAGLAEVASSGDEARAQALAELLATALSIHEQVLTEVMNQVPTAAAPAIQSAIDSSLTGISTVEGLFGEDLPAGAPDDAPMDPPETVPQGMPGDGPAPPIEGAPGGQGSDAQESGRPADLDARLAALSEHTDRIQAAVTEGDHEGAQVALAEFENEVDSLAKELAAVAQEDEARAQALAALLEQALTRHLEVLNQLVNQVPADAQAYIMSSIESSQIGLEAVRAAFGIGLPGSPPSGAPSSGDYGP